MKHELCGLLWGDDTILLANNKDNLRQTLVVQHKEEHGSENQCIKDWDTCVSQENEELHVLQKGQKLHEFVTR